MLPHLFLHSDTLRLVFQPLALCLKSKSWAPHSPQIACPVSYLGAASRDLALITAARSPLDQDRPAQEISTQYPHHETKSQPQGHTINEFVFKGFSHALIWWICWKRLCRPESSPRRVSVNLITSWKGCYKGLQIKLMSTFSIWGSNLVYV